MKLMTLAAVAMFVGAMAFAGCGGRTREERQERALRFINSRVEDTLDDLKASPAQRQKILTLKDQVVGDAKVLMSEHAQTREFLVAQWESPTPDAAEAHALVDQRIDALRAAAHRTTDAALALHAELTPEQRAELSKKMKRYSH